MKRFKLRRRYSSSKKGPESVRNNHMRKALHSLSSTSSFKLSYTWILLDNYLKSKNCAIEQLSNLLLELYFDDYRIP